VNDDEAEVPPDPAAEPAADLAGSSEELAGIRHSRSPCSLQGRVHRERLVKDDDAPYRRWSPLPTWLQVAFHPPERGQRYTVKSGSDGPHFEAYLSYDGVWRHGSSNGERLATTMYLFWLSKA
jgi:hypothetical protein